METTFGKTVETRLLNKKLATTSKSICNMYSNSGNKKYIASPTKRRVVYNKQAFTNPNDPPNRLVAPSTSILTRKNMSHLTDSNGYLSDSDYSFKINNRARRGNKLETFTKGNTSFEEDDDDVNDEDDNEFDDQMSHPHSYSYHQPIQNSFVSAHSSINYENLLTANRFKSIDRQQMKNVRIKRETLKKFENELMARRYLHSTTNQANYSNHEYLNSFHSTNETPIHASYQTDSNRLAHLLSPKLHAKMNTFKSVDQKPQQTYLFNRNELELIKQKQEKLRLQQQKYHQTNYLLWKNFNCNPAASAAVPIEQYEPYSCSSEYARCAQIRKVPGKVEQRSMSTPGTPNMSFTLPRNTRVNQLSMARSNQRPQLNADVNQVGVGDVEFNGLRMFDLSNQSNINHKSGSKYKEVVPLENALLNMNEILKSLTLSVQKKQMNDLNNNIECKQELNKKLEEIYTSPSSSTSISINNPVFIENNAVNNNMNKSNMVNEELVKFNRNMSKLSYSSSIATSPTYSDASKESDKEKKTVNAHDKKSFSPSTSISSYSSGLSADNQVSSSLSSSSCQNRQSDTSMSHDADSAIYMERESKKSISLGRKLKRFFSLNSRSSKYTREQEELDEEENEVRKQKSETVRVAPIVNCKKRL